MFNETPGEFLISYRLTKNLSVYISAIHNRRQTGFYDVSHFKDFKAVKESLPMIIGVIAIIDNSTNLPFYC